VVVFATIACEIAAVVNYRNSTDGQTPLLWIAIAVCGVCAGRSRADRWRVHPARPRPAL